MLLILISWNFMRQSSCYIPLFNVCFYFLKNIHLEFTKSFKKSYMYVDCSSKLFELMGNTTNFYCYCLDSNNDINHTF